MNSLSIFANSTIAFGVISILCLLTLHFTSPEFKPNFRMVSEYALGKHKWLLTMFFLCWGLCSISSGFMLWNVVTTGWAKFGVVLLFVTGIGAIMGGLFDVQHKLHGLAFGIGLPFLPIGALLISYHLIQKTAWQNHSTLLLLSGHAIWISLILMAVAMVLLFSSLKANGIAFGPDAAPMSELPKGVIGINGWANRLLVLCYIAYPILIAKLLLTIINLKN
ncbi:MAG: DUF998 domain-containing protein [Bacteroidetes bacterium]|nr:DUF998 domain-containing protein [Bacteroidota bacterium]MBK9556955.1 DUF998 domain-containing protein [Bacteroidota bacterium]MBL0280940.1 DUF998 domain-containing protein [Bacteroidota bacterium]MBP9880724.1 DUF998 domain-containing protein [Chitinophagales bacterium]